MTEKESLGSHQGAKVLALCGSLRRESFNKKLLLEAMQLAENLHVSVEYFDLKESTLPLYDGDLEVEEGQPNQAKRLREKMIPVSLVFIAACEHNASVSAALKNALDWASRSLEGKPSREAFKDKLFFLMGASPGGTGAARGLIHLRAILENNGAIVIEEAFTLPQAAEAFDEFGHFKSSDLKLKLQTMVQSALKRAKLI